MLGLIKDFVELVQHRENWHHLFDEEKAHLQNAAGENIIAVEHIGSTAVCGISAKPVLDIAVAVGKYSDGEKCVKPFENLDYEYRGEHGIKGRHYFVKGEPRTHHLHLVELNSNFWTNHLLFRDYLRQNQPIAKEYDILKRDLATKYAENRNAYQEGKAGFIENILKVAAFSKNITR